MHSECTECQRLWHSYAIAIREHIRLEYKLRGVALEGDLQQIQALAQDVDAADLARQNLRDAVRLHDETAHRRVASAGSPRHF